MIIRLGGWKTNRRWHWHSIGLNTGISSRESKVEPFCRINYGPQSTAGFRCFKSLLQVKFLSTNVLCLLATWKNSLLKCLHWNRKPRPTQSWSQNFKKRVLKLIAGQQFIHERCVVSKYSLYQLAVQVWQASIRTRAPSRRGRGPNWFVYGFHFSVVYLSLVRSKATG